MQPTKRPLNVCFVRLCILDFPKFYWRALLIESLSLEESILAKIGGKIILHACSNLIPFAKMINKQMIPMLVQWEHV